MRGYPLAAVAFYGPDNAKASKIAVGIISSEGAEPSEMRRWMIEGVDRKRRHPLERKDPACIVDLRGVEAKLAEINENLIRNDLTVLERSIELQKRRAPP